MQRSFYVKQLTRQLINHPYQKYCGIKIIQQKEGYCACKLRVSHDIDNLSHTLHGGVLYSMLDVVSMLATVTLLNNGEYALTTNFSSSMMSSAAIGDTVRIEANVEKFGRNIIYTKCNSWKSNIDNSRKKIASAYLTKFRLSMPS